MACRACRTRKIRCDRARPVCNNCLQRNAYCVYTGERTKRRRLNDHVAPFTGTYRFVEHVAGSRKKAGRSLGNMTSQPDATAQSTCKELQSQPSQRETSEPGLEAHGNDDNSSQSHVSISDGTSSSIEHDERLNNFESHPLHLFSGIEKEDSSSLVDKILDGYGSDCLLDCNPAVWIRSEDGGEYTGPSSGLAGISDLNLKWLQTHVQQSETLCNTLRGIRSVLLSHLRQPKCIATEMWPNPDKPASLKPLPTASDIDKYVDTYFSHVQVIFPILDRASFKVKLSQYHRDPTKSTSSWKALLNAVIASGLRAELSDETAEAFQQSGREAWGYFRNALCYETQLVHGATDLMAVQALVVMAVFAQGMSSPQRLEYTLCSTASRLAHGLGLNIHPQVEWNISESEQQERNRTFWVIYCLDKTIALRTGRPASIRHDEISCLFPRNVSFSQPNNANTTRPDQISGEDVQEFDFFLVLAKFSRLCNKITGGLYSAVALRRASIDLLAMAKGILSDLEAWKLDIPANIRPGQSFSRFSALNYGSRQRLLALHFFYNYAICAVYRRFSPMFTDNEKEQQHTTRCPLHTNPTTDIEAARSMVLLTKHLDIESYAPGWLVFYFPLTALTTIFMHIVCNPTAASTNNDIALMDAVIGFFGRIEFVTSGEAAFTQMREFVQHARLIVLRSRNDSVSQDDRSHLPNPLQSVTLPLPPPIFINSQGNIDLSDNIQDSVVQGDEDHCLAFTDYNITPHLQSQSHASKQSFRDHARTGLSNSAEQLDQSLNGHSALQILGGFPNPPSDIAWMDEWLSTRTADSLVYGGGL